MKALLTSILALCLAANVHGQTISLSGTSETEQAAKLELIRILNERMNKLTVAQLNARIIVSRGVSNYYKVDEIVKMNDNIYAYRSKYVGVAQKLEAGNPGFSAHQGNGFTYKYIVQLNDAVSKAKAITDQLGMILKSGSPVMLPAMPTFSISQSSSSSPVTDTGQEMLALNSQYGVTDADAYNALSPEKRAEYDSKFKDLSLKMYGELQADNAKNNQKLLGILGNMIGAAFGAPMAGTLIMSVVQSAASGNGIAGLVGSIVDSFQIPVDYYDSNTLKLTDAERLKIIDELHTRISELYQQVAALGSSLSTETKVRYNELSGPRNEQILYGPKK